MSCDSTMKPYSCRILVPFEGQMLEQWMFFCPKGREEQAMEQMPYLKSYSQFQAPHGWTGFLEDVTASGMLAPNSAYFEKARRDDDELAAIIKGLDAKKKRTPPKLVFPKDWIEARRRFESPESPES